MVSCFPGVKGNYVHISPRFSVHVWFWEFPQLTFSTLMKQGFQCNIRLKWTIYFSPRCIYHVSTWSISTIRIFVHGNFKFLLKPQNSPVDNFCWLRITFLLIHIFFVWNVLSQDHFIWKLFVEYLLFTTIVLIYKYDHDSKS